MKRIYLIFLFIFSLQLPGFSQNLVPNPSFEDTVSCPDFPGQIWRAQGWYIAENTPDYYNVCSNANFPTEGVPNNEFGYRNPATGVAYAGILVYNSIDFYHEKVGIELINSLSVGTRYYVTFKLGSSSVHSPTISNGGTDKTGILFSTNKFDLNNTPPTNNFCQVKSDAIITDTLGWKTIKGSFIADSAYRFITIGNFYADTATSTLLYWHASGNFLRAYYYLDDICVTTDSLGCDFSSFVVTNENTKPFFAFPNPAIDVINIKMNTIIAANIQLFNSMGVCVAYCQPVPSHGIYEIQTTNQATGIYLLKVTSEQGYYTQKISIINNHL